MMAKLKQNNIVSGTITIDFCKETLINMNNVLRVTEYSRKNLLLYNLIDLSDALIEPRRTVYHTSK